ncbi:MAG: hypothetical protein ACM31C_27295 [Acidobacteriota bacterium]
MSEVSREFYAAVVAAAEEAVACDDPLCAEALYRRAIHIAGYLGGDPLHAAESLANLTRWPATPSALASERVLVRVESQCHLMGWQPEQIVFSPSSPLPELWYLLAPPSWRDGTRDKAAAMLSSIHARCNARLARSEPSDANYIACTVTRAEIPTAERMLAEPWQDTMAPPAWCQSRGFVVEDTGWFFAAHASDFVPMVHLAYVLAGELASDVSRAKLLQLGFTEALVARHGQPAKEMAEALAYFIAT